MPIQSRPRPKYPKMHVEQRWRPRKHDGWWCIIQDGKIYPISVSRPFECDRLMQQNKQHGISSVRSPDPTFSRRSPPGVRNEDKWLRYNDTRHKNYAGA